MKFLLRPDVPPGTCWPPRPWPGAGFLPGMDVSVEWMAGPLGNLPEPGNIPPAGFGMDLRGWQAGGQGRLLVDHSLGFHVRSELLRGPFRHGPPGCKVHLPGALPAAGLSQLHRRGPWPTMVHGAGVSRTTRWDSSPLQACPRPGATARKSELRLGGLKCHLSPDLRGKGLYNKLLLMRGDSIG